MHLTIVATDYVASMKRLPENTSLEEVLDFFVKRHPTGLPPNTVRDILDELIETKIKSGKSEVYIKDLRLRLTQFADALNVRLCTITGKQIEEFLHAPRKRGEDGPSYLLSGRTQNNYRQLIDTLF